MGRKCQPEPRVKKPKLLIVISLSNSAVVAVCMSLCGKKDIMTKSHLLNDYSKQFVSAIYHCVSSFSLLRIPSHPLFIFIEQKPTEKHKFIFFFLRCWQWWTFSFLPRFFSAFSRRKEIIASHYACRRELITQWHIERIKSEVSGLFSWFRHASGYWPETQTSEKGTKIFKEISGKPKIFQKPRGNRNFLNWKSGPWKCWPGTVARVVKQASRFFVATQQMPIGASANSKTKWIFYHDPLRSDSNFHCLRVHTSAAHACQAQELSIFHWQLREMILGWWQFITAFIRRSIDASNIACFIVLESLQKITTE